MVDEAVIPASMRNIIPGNRESLRILIVMKIRLLSSRKRYLISAFLRIVAVAFIAFAAFAAVTHFHSDGIQHNDCLLCVFLISHHSSEAALIFQGLPACTESRELFIFIILPSETNLLSCLWPHAPPPPLA